MCALVPKVLNIAVNVWRAEAQLLRHYSRALASISQQTTQRLRRQVLKIWAYYIRQDLMQQRWNSTARRALRTWRWRVTLKWEVQVASMELARRMNRWLVFQAWCSWLRMHENNCAVRWMLNQSLVLSLTGMLRRWRASLNVREELLAEGRLVLALHVSFLLEFVLLRWNPCFQATFD